MLWQGFSAGTPTITPTLGTRSHCTDEKTEAEVEIPQSHPTLLLGSSGGPWTGPSSRLPCTSVTVTLT